MGHLNYTSTQSSTIDELGKSSHVASRQLPSSFVTRSILSLTPSLKVTITVPNEVFGIEIRKESKKTTTKTFYFFFHGTVFLIKQ